MLRGRYRVIVQTEWNGAPADAMIALHARRSAASIAAYRGARPEGALAVVLSGTDLYRDLPASAEAARSLDVASRIVVLQDDALRHLEPRWRRKAEVIYQSATPLRGRRKRAGRLDCVIVGHLRAEKDPATLFEAVERLPWHLPIFLRHVGAPLDDELARRARALEKRDSRYRYSGALPHGLTRAAIAAAHVLVHPSRMEGGANVIAEALCSGTPAIASRVSGNVGMLGRRYPGYFTVGDTAGLARLLVRALDDDEYLPRLRAACRERCALFRPAAERRAIRSLVARLLAQARR